jgi:hypothetical protein
VILGSWVVRPSSQVQRDSGGWTQEVGLWYSTQAHGAVPAATVTRKFCGAERVIAV